MKLRNIIFGLFASVAVLVSCNPDEELLGPASLKVNGSEVTLSKDGDTKTIALKATREWTASISPEESGFTVSPMSGTGSNDPQTITVTAEANTGKDAHAILTITSGELEPVSVRLYQPGEEGGNWTLKELRDWGTETPFPLGAKTEVTVVSNKDISTVTNVTAFVQDETAGLQLRFASAHSFAKGEKISVLLEGLKLTTYQDAIQIDAIPVDNATSISTGNTVAAKTTSLEDFMANRLEGQYIELDVNVQPRADFQNEPEEDVPAETPDNPAPEGETDTPAEPTSTEDTEEVVWKFVNNTSLTYDEVWFETQTGENFTIKTYKGSAIKDTPIPANSGKIKGIANIQEGRLQIIFTSTDDFAGLDQPYFESAHYVNFDKAADWVSQEAGAYTLKVSSNTAWTVSASGSWVTLDKTSGEGDAEIIVTYAAATEGATEANSTELTFSYAGKTKVFTLQQRSIETITVAQFNAKAESNDVYYRLTGIITRYHDSGYGTDTAKKKGRIYIQDEEGNEILIYGLSPEKDGNQDDYGTLGLRVGDQVTVDCVRTSYSDTPQGGNAYLVSFVELVPDPVEAPISTVYEAEDEDLVKVSGTVVALCKTGFILEDSSAAIFVFENKLPTVKIGNKVTVTGERDTYNSGVQISAVEEVTVTDDSETAPVYPEAIDLTSTIDTYTFHEVEYVKLKGSVSISTSGYVNIYPEGTTKYGSLYSQIEDMSSVNGGIVTVYAYVVNKYQEKAFNVVLVDYEVHDFLAADDINVVGSATSAEIDVKSNLEWEISTEDAWVTLGTTSGSGSASVPVTFDVNPLSTAARTATFTISANGMEPITVSLTQAVYEVLPAFTTDEDIWASYKYIEGSAYINNKVKPNGGEEVNALKIGKASGSGTITITVPAGTKKIGFYAAGWNGKSVKLTVSADGMASSEMSIPSQTTLAGSGSSFEVISTKDQYYVKEFTTVPEAATEITMSANLACFIWGINVVE